ncbi:MAG: HTTM domain-containing protein [Microthrixaceae bacterium]
MPIIPDVVGITSNQRLRTLAAERVPGASLRFFRVVFAAVVAISALRLLILDWTSTLYSNPTIHFAYSGLGWVPVLPSTLMRIQVAAIAIAAVAVAFGFMYRYSIALVWFLFSWMEFTEATVYLNHYWFISVMSFLMIFLPLDSRGTVPRGTLWMVRFQVGVVYIFAGLAKINTDWLLQGLPMALWLPGRTDLPIVGPMLNHQSVAIALAWGGAIFDCAVVWFLLWRRTRLWAWLCVVAFHIATFILFPPIGVFPFLMVAASLVFFEPDWPIELAGRVTGWLAGRQVMPDAFARRLESAGASQDGQARRIG